MVTPSTPIGSQGPFQAGGQAPPIHRVTNPRQGKFNDIPSRVFYNLLDQKLDFLMGYRDLKKTPFLPGKKRGLDTVVPSFFPNKTPFLPKTKKRTGHNSSKLFHKNSISAEKRKEGLDTVVPGMFGKATPILFLYHFLYDFLYIFLLFVL